MPPLDPATVLRAQQGDRDALDRLLAGLRTVLAAFFTRRVGARVEVDDLVQNTLVRVHHGLPELKDPERLRPFAMKAALFELQDYYRGRYASREQLYDPEHAPEQPVEPAGADGLDAERALGHLSDRARRVLELRAYGYRYEEIAGLIGSTEAAVKMLVKRSLDKLRGLVGAVALLVGAGLLSGAANR